MENSFVALGSAIGCEIELLQQKLIEVVQLNQNA